MIFATAWTSLSPETYRPSEVFVWQGDFRILIAMVKYVEDRMNVEHDTKAVGVQSIILIEDNINFYSSYLPLIYAELFKHSQNLMIEGLNPSHAVASDAGAS